MTKVRFPDGQEMLIAGFTLALYLPENRRRVSSGAISDPQARRVLFELAEAEADPNNALRRAVRARLPRTNKFWRYQPFRALAHHYTAEEIVSRIPGAKILSPPPPVPDWDKVDKPLLSSARGL